MNSAITQAQTKIYKDNSIYSCDIICNINNDMVYKGDSSYSGDIVCNVNVNKIYNQVVHTVDMYYTLYPLKQCIKTIQPIVATLL